MGDIIESPLIQPVGMLCEDQDSGNHLYYFNHLRERCGTTFTIPARDFLGLIEEPIPREVLTGSARCERHCLSIEDLSECQEECAYAPLRRFLLSMMAERDD